MKPKKYIEYYDGTKKKCWEYYKLNDKYHRENGPASIHYYESGNIECERYYINGELLTKQEFDKYTRKRDSKIFDKLLEEMANET